MRISGKVDDKYILTCSKEELDALVKATNSEIEHKYSTTDKVSGTDISEFLSLGWSKDELTTVGYVVADNYVSLIRIDRLSRTNKKLEDLCVENDELKKQISSLRLIEEHIMNYKVKDD